MKRKTVFLPAAIVLVLLAVYGVWHYSPLRHLTRSISQPDAAYTGTTKSRNKPIIITKKILPETDESQQTGDLPKPLVVLKNLSPQENSQPAGPQVKSTNSSAAGEKTPQSVQPAKSVEPQPLQKAAVSDQPDSRHPYSIMLSSCKLPQSARKIVSNYQKVGLSPYVVKVEFDKGDEWLRVLAGHYKTRQEALKAKQEHRLSGAIVKRTPYTNLIGIYPSIDEMKTELRRIKALGYSPYFLKTRTGQYRLVVGAFVTRKGAEKLQAELQTKGIQNTVIIR